jgi:hypothetical protein
MFKRNYDEIASMSPGEIIRHHGKWCEYNFPGKHDPLSGILEEMGEATHCLLKRFQGIRGFDNPAYFQPKFADALADMVVYMIHYAYLHDLPLTLEPAPHWQHFFELHPDHRSCTISFLHELACAMADSNLRTQDVYLQLLYMNVWCMAKHENMELPKVLYYTLVGVWERDWQKNKVGAGGVSAQQQAKEPLAVVHPTKGILGYIDGMPEHGKPAEYLETDGEPQEIPPAGFIQDVPPEDPFRNLARLEDEDDLALQNTIAEEDAEGDKIAT